MLIVSNFHDYYDTISVYGVDKEYVYERKEKVLMGTFGKEDRNRGHWAYEEKYSKTKSGIKTDYVVHKRVVGFCGKLYPVVVVEKKVGTEKAEQISFYSTEKVHSFFAKEKITLIDRLSYWSMRDFSTKSEKALNSFFEGSMFKELKAEFQKNKCPVFIYGRFPSIGRSERLILNPKLRDYKFAQVKDPATAFQDIFMYIAGVLGISTPVMVKLSDKELAKKRGHGDPYSFRKLPQKKGKKR